MLCSSPKTVQLHSLCVSLPQIKLSLALLELFCISFMLCTSPKTVQLHSLCVSLPQIKLSLALLELFLFSVLYRLFHYT